MQALLTGGAGFVGQWLARSLLARGDSVDLAGLDREFTGPPILDADEQRSTRWLTADVRDAAALDAAIEASRPDVIFHLAGVSFPPDADRSPAGAFDVNVLGAVRLLASVAKRKAAGSLDPVVLIVGSGVQYGRHDDGEMPLDETAEQRPLNAYGASKSAQETIALQVVREHGVRVVCTRSFNHSGIGHGAQYLLPSLVARARGVAAGAAPCLSLGNDVVRDYVHVDDVVSAYVLLAEHGRPGEVYNVASGRGVSARQLATDVLHQAGVRADISVDATLVRATDIPTLIGSPAKLSRETGWTPRKTHLDIIDDLLRSTGPVPVTAHAAQN